MKTINRNTGIDLSSITGQLFEFKQSFTMLKSGVAKLTSAEVKESKSGNPTVLCTFENSKGEVATIYLRVSSYSDFSKSFAMLKYLFIGNEAALDNISVDVQAVMSEDNKEIYVFSEEEDDEARKAEISEGLKMYEDEGYDNVKLEDGSYLIVEFNGKEDLCNTFAELANDLVGKNYALQINSERSYPAVTRISPSKI